MSRRFTYVIKSRGPSRSAGGVIDVPSGLRPIPGARGEAPSTNGVRMTTFAERKERSRRGLGPTHSSPAGQQDPTGREGAPAGQPGAERPLLRRRLKEKRREIRAQIEVMEALTARQRQELGRRAFRDLMKLAGEEEEEEPMAGRIIEGRGRVSAEEEEPMAGRLIEGRGRVSAEEEETGQSLAEGLSSIVRAASPYATTMGRLNETLNAVQCELELLSFRASRLPPAAGTGPPRGRRDGGIDGGKLPAGSPGGGAGGERGASGPGAEEGGGEPTGPPPRGGAEGRRLQGPSKRKPVGNLETGGTRPAEDVGQWAEELEVDTVTRRRTLFLHRQQQRAEEVKLRRCQQRAVLRQKREEVRRKVKEEGLRKEAEPRPLQDAGRPRTSMEMIPAKAKTRSKSAGGTPQAVGSAGGARLRAQELGQTKAVGATHLTPNKTIPAEREWERNPVSTLPPAEQTGLKLFKELSAKSNRLILHNALSYCCLAGKANASQRNLVIEELMKCGQNQCLILFRDHQCQFRSLYSFTPETEDIQRLWGMGPKVVTKEMIESLYKYNSDRKQFQVIPSKTMSANVDALTIWDHLWQGRKRSALGVRT